MKQNYDTFANVYRQVAGGLDLFAAQTRVLKVLFDVHGVGKQSRILDAACGTGDVVCGLVRDGYAKVSAIDGSGDMLAQWPADAIALRPPPSNWRDLAAYFETAGQFDVVYFLGNSLAHATKEEVTKSLKVIYECGLTSSGLLVLDLRSWLRQDASLLVEQGRPVDVCRCLQRVELDGQPYWLMDRVSYEGERQHVDYDFIPIRAGHDSRKARLSYTRFDSHQVIEWLQTAGYARTCRYDFSKLKWPYTVVTAQKGI